MVNWISHRGYCDSAVENTRNSFDAALKLGFTHLETDLRATRDGQLVLSHDSSLLRTCGEDLKVEDLDWVELQAIRTKDGQGLLRLFDLVKRYSECRWIFDIKGPADLRTLDLLSRWQEHEHGQDWLKVQTRFLLWSQSAEIHAHRLYPDIPTLAQEGECYRAGLAVMVGLPGWGGIKEGRTYSLPSQFGGVNLFTSRILRTYHQRKAGLLAYLPENEEKAKIASSLGFDEILTNGRKLF